MDIDMNEQHWMDKKCPPINCRKKQCECGLEKVFLSASLGDDSAKSPVAPKNGEYCNAIVVYEANGHVYIYSKEGIPTLVEGGANNIEKILDELEDGLAQEILDRQAADNTLQEEIDDIKNSPDVVDIVATYAALQAYDTSKLGDNDIVRVLQDEQHDGQSTYYRWDKQNSTWTYIGAVGDYYTKGQVDTLLAGKQDDLTAGSNISITQVDDDLVISATDTTYSNFVGTDGNTGGTAGLVPAPATTDAGKFLKADGTWDTAGGGGPTVVQTTGASTTDVMSQNATTGMVYADPATKLQVQVGDSANGASTYAVAIGANSKASNRCVAIGGGSSLVIERTRATGDNCVALGAGAQADNSYSTAVGGGARAGAQYSLALGYGATSPATYDYAIALGAGARTAHTGEMNIGTGAGSGNGYNSSDYRLISGVYDGQNAHDAVTLSQLNGRVKQNAGAPTTATVGTVGQLLEDTTNGKLYQCTAASGGIYTWTEVGAGGGGPTVVQTTGTSTTDVMSQNATTSMVFSDPATKYNVQIGASSTSGSTGSIAIGRSSQAVGGGSVVSIGNFAYAGADGAIALGARSNASSKGQMDIGTSQTILGYNNTNYRLLTGVHDPVNAHDAATKGYVDSIVVNYATLTAAGAPTTSTAAVSVGQLYYDSTNDDYYYCSAIDTTDPQNPSYTWSALSTGGGGGPTVVQTTGTSTTDVMSQNAVTSMIFADPSTAQNVSIGNANAGSSAVSVGRSAYGAGEYSIAIGYQSNTYSGSGAVAIGQSARARKSNAIAIGYTANSGQEGGASSIAIGANSHAGEESVAIGENAGNYTQNNTVSIGRGAQAWGRGSVAIGDQTAMPSTSVRGTVSIKAISNGYGYNGASTYRLLTGLYDGQEANDAVNLGQLNSRVIGSLTAAPTTSTVGSVGSLVATVESGTGHLYICTDDTGGSYTWSQLV